MISLPIRGAGFHKESFESIFLWFGSGKSLDNAMFINSLSARFNPGSSCYLSPASDRLNEISDRVPCNTGSVCE